jgi:membrane protein
MLAYLDTRIGWGELLKRTAKETQADNGLGLAAQLAYYFFLALFPALLFLIALAGVFTSGDDVARLVNMMSGTAPPDVINIVQRQLTALSGQTQGGLMTFGVVAALWSSSSAMVALIDALNRAYDVEDGRSWWRQRLTAILLTIAVAVFILASFALVIAGPELARSLAGRFGLGTAFEWTWKIVQWPVVCALVSVAFSRV